MLKPQTILYEGSLIPFDRSQKKREKTTQTDIRVQRSRFLNLFYINGSECRSKHSNDTQVTFK